LSSSHPKENVLPRATLPKGGNPPSEPSLEGRPNAPAGEPSSAAHPSPPCPENLRGKQPAKDESGASPNGHPLVGKMLLSGNVVEPKRDLKGPGALELTCVAESQADHDAGMPSPSPSLPPVNPKAACVPSSRSRNRRWEASRPPRPVLLESSECAPSETLRAEPRRFECRGSGASGSHGLPLCRRPCFTRSSRPPISPVVRRLFSGPRNEEGVDVFHGTRAHANAGPNPDGRAATQHGAPVPCRPPVSVPVGAGTGGPRNAGQASRAWEVVDEGPRNGNLMPATRRPMHAPHPSTHDSLPHHDRIAATGIDRPHGGVIPTG
jgi:hypothetical protein